MKRALPLAVVALAFCGGAQAEIVQGTREPSPLGGIGVPKGKAPLRLECWIDGRREVVEISPAQLPPATPAPSTRVVIRDADGTSTVVVVPVPGASGCLPLR